MWVLSLLALLCLGLTIAAIILAVMKSYRWYWVAAVASWVFSFLTGFSIGLFVFSVTIVTTVLALGYTVGAIRSGWQVLLSIVVGLVLWALLFAYGGIPWLFYPLIAIFTILFDGF